MEINKGKETLSEDLNAQKEDKKLLRLKSKKTIKFGSEPT